MAVILAAGGVHTAPAAKAATSTITIVFAITAVFGVFDFRFV
ncbi:MAG: hypothetical protein WB803_17775 [Pseudolabrys sp.]